MDYTQTSVSPYPAGPSRHATRSDCWQPLPFIYSGIAVHPYHPSPTPPASPLSPQTPKPLKYSLATSLDTVAQNGAATIDVGKTNPYEVPLEVGDEVFAFEEFRKSVESGDKGDVWYRGYVVQAASLPTLGPSPSSITTFPVPYPKPEPSVLIGIFPSSCVHVRPEVSVDDGTIGTAYTMAVKKAQEKDNKPGPSWGAEMEAVKEEDEEEESQKVGSPKQDRLEESDLTNGVVEISSGGPATDSKRHSMGGVRARRPKSLILDKGPTIADMSGEEDKEQPPLPRLTAGDSTIAGQTYPLVDEISCAIREWYGRLPTYLANKEYRLFSTVTQHIDALFLGRRQLLSQTLSLDELTRMRRECVSRLVKCNVAQGLDVIVRSLEDGSVMVVEKERAFAGASWIGGIPCYVYQVQLAYIDLVPLDAILGRSSKLSLPNSVSMPKLSLNNGTLGEGIKSSSRPFYHLLLDVHAFIANPCRPGETAELFFSLYNSAEARFVTEEFCLILNHLGSPARDSEQRIGRLRTLFADLKLDDLGSSVYLVCRLIRNGALKMRGDTASGTLDSVTRSGTLGRSGATYSQMGTLLSTPSIAESATDDSFSVTSGFGGHRTTTVETAMTTAASMVDGRPTFRRPLGCAAISLPHLAKMMNDAGDGTEISMPIYAPRDEAAFGTIHEDIISGRMKELVSSSRTEAIAVSLKVFHGPTQQVIREHPSALHDISISARLGFSDVASAEEFRNDIYVKLWSGMFFPAPTASGGSMRVRKSTVAVNNGNVQVTVEVRRQDGTIVSEALFSGGSGEPPTACYHSLVFHHNDKPTFGELVKVSLPIRADDCHLFLTFRSRGKDRSFGPDAHELERPFAFAYLPLIRDSACVKDGSHALVLYRMEKNLQPAPHIYFEASAVDHGGVTVPLTHKNMTPLRDRMLLRTYLCSNIHTQDDTLRLLFRWQGNQADLDAISSALQMFAFVNEEEIAKFVPRVLDALFGIMVSNLGEKQDELDDMVFRSLSKVLAMSSDRRFPGFVPVLENYIATKFNYPASSFHLLRSMKSVMSRPESKEYRSFLKVWHLFFRFVIRSRELDRARGIGLDATSKHIEADFKRQTKGILSELNTLMSRTDKSLIGTQTLAVQHYADILPDLGQVFPPLEIAEMVIEFADTLIYAKGSIAVYKLLLLLSVVQSVFDTTEARALLVPALVRWVKPHLGKFDPGFANQGEDAATRDSRKIKWLECNRLAVTVIAWTVNKLQEWYNHPVILEDQSLRIQEEDNLEYCLTLLPSLLESYTELASNDVSDVLRRHRATSPSIYKTTPDVFPMSTPFALISELPPPSLLDKQAAAEDGLATSKTFVLGLTEITVVIFTLVLAAPRHNLFRWLSELYEIEGTEVTSKTIQTVFSFCLSVVHNEAYPPQWLTLNLMSLGSIIRLLDPVAEMLERHFVPSVEQAEAFDVPLWNSAFRLLCAFCGNDQLALEDMTQQRRRAQWIISGDLRDDGAALLSRLWNAIGWESSQNGPNGSGAKFGGYQTRFTSLAGRILSLCLSTHDGLCEAAVEILFSMIYAEYTLNGSFGDIQSEIFAKLDELFSIKTSSSSVSDPTSRAYFVAQLRAVFEASPSIDTQFQTKVGYFMDEIELFIDLLLALRELPQTPSWRDERGLALYRLLLFTKRIGRPDLYMRFVHQLVAISLELNDHLSAGYALKLHAELHEWNGERLLDDFPLMGLPPQNEFDRKEALLYHVMDHFAEAEAYEAALEICQDLTRQHERFTYDVAKLGDLLVYQARLWEKIGSTSRYVPEYFRVAYFGEVNSLDKGKDFVVRGQSWERYADFCESIQLKHPTAIIHRSKIPPPESVRLGEEPVVWVTSLTPEPDMSRPVFKENVQEPVQSYWRNNAVSRFSCSRPYQRDKTDLHPVLTWTEKTVLTTREELPGVLCRSEVINIVYEQISPLSNAVKEVAKATKALQNLARGDIDVKQLGNAINGAVDSPVSGGVKLYRSTFLDGDYASQHPAETAQIDDLRKAIRTYVERISDALAVHRTVCRDVPFHEALRSHFNRAFENEIATLPKAISASALDAPLPPLPVVNGHDRLQVPSLQSRMSTFSMGSAAAYVLPALRLGPTPSPSPSPSPSGVFVSPSKPRAMTGVPVTAVSSPRQSITSARGSRPSTNNNSPAPGAPGGLLPRTLSAVGSSMTGSAPSRDSISLASEGTAGGIQDQPNGTSGAHEAEEGVSRNGTVSSKRGFRRLSSLIRR